MKNAEMKKEPIELVCWGLGLAVAGLTAASFMGWFPADVSRVYETLQDIHEAAGAIYYLS